MDDPVRQPGRADRRRQQGRNRRFGDIADDQGRRGDSELGAGKLERQGTDGPKRAARTTGTVPGRLLELAPVDRHQGELGGDEQGVARDESDDQYETENVVDHRLSEGRAPPGRADRNRPSGKSAGCVSACESTHPADLRGGT